MKNQVAIRWARKPWLAALLLVALGSRLLVPAGFMPGHGGLVLCSGQGPMTLTMAHDMASMNMSGIDMSSMDMSGTAMPGHSGHPSRGGHASDHENMGICPFAAAASPLAAAHAVAVVAFAHLIPTSIELPLQEFIPRGTIVPTRLPRGPPSLA